jgi:hypothetical protein
MLFAVSLDYGQGGLQCPQQLQLLRQAQYKHFSMIRVFGQYDMLLEFHLVTSIFDLFESE